MAVPTFKVEMGFGYGPFTTPASISWTDVTVYVKSDIRIARGRSTEMDKFSPGSCSFTLDNHLRRFDPEYSSGAYYGNLVANVPVRVTLTLAGVDYRRFYGFVDGWPQSYEHPGDASVTVNATDAFKLLSRRRLPSSVWAVEVAADSPHLWWRLGDDNSDVKGLDSSGNGYDGTYTGAYERGHASLVADESDTSTLFTSEGPGYGRMETTSADAEVAPLSSVGGMAVELWMQADAAPVQVFSQNGNFGTGVDIVIDDAGLGFGTAVYAYSEGDASNSVAFYNSGVCNGRPHHIAFRLTGASGDTPTGEIYVDGVAGGAHHTGPFWTTFWGSVAFVDAGNYHGGYNPSGGATVPTNSVTVDEVVTYNTNLTPARILAHYQAGAAPWNLDTSGVRMGRVLDAIHWPSAQRNIDTGETTLADADLAARAALDYMQAVEFTEQGRLFIAGDGRVTFHSRDHDLATSTSNTSQATFTDDGTGIQIEPGMTWTLDDRYLFREVTAQRDGGKQITVRDSTLTTTDDVQTKTLGGLMVRTDAEARDVAESFLLRYKTAKLRTDGWECKPLADSTKWTSLLSLELGYRVTVERKPQNLGTRISKPLLLEQIAETIPVGAMADYTIAFAASPVDTTSYFILDSSLLDGPDVLR